MNDVVLHLVLTTAAGCAMVGAPLLVGRLTRPNKPTTEKESIYECGEETVGSSFIQFDIRFYTVALIFIVFDVELAFFFPWASLFGSVMALTDTRLLPDDPMRLAMSQDLLGKDTQLGIVGAGSALSFAWFLLVDLLVFFGAIMVGFAYLWKRGDLDWVRAMPRKNAAQDSAH